jgi:hypothetical protein
VKLRARGRLRFSPCTAAGGLLVLALTPVAALQAGAYWAEPAALLGALGLLMLGLSRRT